MSDKKTKSGDNCDEFVDDNGDLPISQSENSQISDHIGRAARLVKFGLEFITRNGQLTFKAPVALPSDVAELEYVSALHQCASMQAMREDGSITASEIACFLRSRHGIDVAPEIVRTAVLQDGLTPDKDESHPENDDVMDLVELASVLIIPNLLSLRYKGEGQKLLPSESLRSSKPQNRPSTRDRKAADDGILYDVLSHVLDDCTGDSMPKRLDADLVRDILRGYGEGTLAQDEDLVAEMVEVAACDNVLEHDEDMAGIAALLDIRAFAEALTSDVARMFDPGRYERHSTNFEDVWLYAPDEKGRDKSDNRSRGHWDEEAGTLRAAVLDNECLLDRLKAKNSFHKNSELQENGRLDGSLATANNMTVRRLFMGQSIDYTTDNYRTRVHTLFLWMAFVAFYVAYLGFGLLGGYQNEQCMADNSLRKTVSCPLVAGIANQLLMISELIIFGTPFIIIGSVGNSIEDGREALLRMVGCIVLFALYICIFFSVGFQINYWISTENSKKATGFASLGLGLVVVLMQSLHVVMILFRKCFPGRGWYSPYFTFGNVSYEAKIKRSALFKVDRMFSNAHSIHRTVIKNKRGSDASAGLTGNTSHFLSNFGMVLNEYTKLDGKTTYIGGIGWTWKRICDGTLFTEEGIWISGRVAAGTVFQVIVIFVMPTLCTIFLPQLMNQLLDPNLDGMELRSRISLGAGIVCAFFTSVLVTTLFIPTMVSTTLKFRRGVLPSLRSEDFLRRYRFALDQVTLVHGGMFWGVLFSSIAVALITGGFVYLLLWKETSHIVLGIIGNLLGLGVVLVAKLIIMQIIRFTHYAAFYRKKPLGVNVLTIVMECYSIGISVWFMIVRLIKIVIIAALYLGRIDTPLFASGVGIFGPLEIDNWPTVSRKEILIHEAHRHPYLETLGYLYMMQLRYRNGFAKRACSAWRLIFVLALMPCLHKYRDMARPEHFGEEDDENPNEDDNMLINLAAQSPPGKVRLQNKQGSRFLRQTMVSSRWLSFKINSDDDFSTNAPTPDEDRITEIKEQIRCLQTELSGLESKADKRCKLYVVNEEDCVSV